jgi:hypothetical protein
VQVLRGDPDQLPLKSIEEEGQEGGGTPQQQEEETQKQKKANDDDAQQVQAEKDKEEETATDKAHQEGVKSDVQPANEKGGEAEAAAKPIDVAASAESGGKAKEKESAEEDGGEYSPPPPVCLPRHRSFPHARLSADLVADVAHR